MATKYVFIDDELYCRTAEDLFHNWLNSDEARVAMREVHEDICGKHQSAHKMKWLFKKSRFLLAYHDCFK